MFHKIFGKLGASVLISLVCVALSSCFETEQEFTLNPDGTGKMTINSVFPSISLDGKKTQNDASLQKAVANFLEQSKGIEAWRDVSYAWGEDGRIKFKGTGYFSDLSAVELQNVGMMAFAWKSDGKTGQLTMDFKSDGDEEEKAIASDPVERAKEIKAERAQFQQSKPMLLGILSGMKHTATFKLPGKAGKTENFVTAADGRVGLKITGAKLIEAMEKLVNDDAWMAKNAFDAQNAPTDMEAISESLFGSKAPVAAQRVSMAAPLFDYAKELAAARIEMTKLQEKLGPQFAPAAAGQPFESLEVAGVRLIRKVSDDTDLRAFNYEPGFTLSVLGKFSGSVLSVTDKSEVLKAIGDDGSDLLPGSDFNRRISFPTLSEDRSAVLFEVRMLEPFETVKSLREVSGTIQYVVSSGTMEVDLGFVSLKAGASGKALDAKIKEIKNGWKDDGSKQMEIELSVDTEAIKELILIDGAKRIVMERRGSSSFGNGSVSYTYEAEKGIPESGKLIAVLHDGLKTYDIPFKLENLTLLGTPAGK